MALATTGAETEAVFASANTCGGPAVQPGHYRVEAKMISVSASAARDLGDGVVLGYFSDDKVAKLIGSPGEGTLSFPSVEAAELLPVHIDMTRNVPLPHATGRETGINLDVVPQKQGMDFSFQISIKNVRFQGFEDQATNIPIYQTGAVTTAIPASAQPPAGYYCINIPVPQKLSTTYDADGRKSASIADANERQLLFVKISRG